MTESSCTVYSSTRHNISRCSGGSPKYLVPLTELTDTKCVGHYFILFRHTEFIRESSRRSSERLVPIHLKRVANFIDEYRSISIIGYLYSNVR
jgi:hypothetical protein